MNSVPQYGNGVTSDNSDDARQWNSLPYVLEQEGGITKANKLFQEDGQLKAFTTTDAITESTTFGKLAVSSCYDSYKPDLPV